MRPTLQPLAAFPPLKPAPIPPCLTPKCTHPGPSPSAAARLLHQLRLFPEVFTLPPGVLALVGEEYGGPCEACLEAAVSIMNVQEQPVSVGGWVIPLVGTSGVRRCS